MKCESKDVGIKSMAGKMKTKYTKCWGDLDILNILLLIVVVLNPYYKFIFATLLEKCALATDL